MPAEDEHEFPSFLDYLWAFFSEISLGIASSGMAPAQLTWSEIDAWTRLTGNILEPWESRALVILGALRASIQSERLKTQPNAKPASSKGGRRG